jgi:8-oxo-dGTP pyrophosphatase MutT (NUDIX family)
MAAEIEDILYPTPFKFMAHLKKFLAGILEDPCGTEVDQFFSGNGITKEKLLKTLLDFAIIKRKMTIDDHDAEGNPHTAKMTVRYSVPKQRFSDKSEALFSEFFPDGPKVKITVNEEGAAGGGGACSCSGVDGNGFGSGEVNVPLFGTVVSRGSIYNHKKKKGKVDESVSEDRDSNTSSAVYVYAKGRNGEWCVLCARRASSANTEEGGKWNPPMGHRHVGESFKDCVKRECMEESGFDLSEYEDQLIAANRYDWGVEYVLPITDRNADTLEINGHNDGENSEFTWMPIKKIKQTDWAWSCKEHAVRNFRKYIGGKE